MWEEKNLTPAIPEHAEGMYAYNRASEKKELYLFQNTISKFRHFHADFVPACKEKFSQQVLFTGKRFKNTKTRLKKKKNHTFFWF